MIFNKVYLCKFKLLIMKTIFNSRAFLMLFMALLLFSCASNSYRGSASDRTGTNGATNGTGKIAR